MTEKQTLPAPMPPEDTAKPGRLDALLASAIRPDVHFLSWLIMGLLAGFLIWSTFARLDEVSVAQGEVVPHAKVKVVQHLEGGIIRRLDVAEGGRVAKNQVLMQLDLGGRGTGRKELTVQRDSLLLRRARLQAEATGAAPDFPKAVADLRPDLVRTERDTMQARRTELEGRRGVIVQQVRQRELQVKELQAKRATVIARLELGRERLRLSKSLLDDGLTPRMDHLQLKREVEGLAGEKTVLDQTVPRAKSAYVEARAKLAGEAERFRREARESLGRLEPEIARVREALEKASERAHRTEIRSPIDGFVKNLRFNTIGGVVRPGEAIMEIVPVGDELVIQARLSPVDRGYVREGQRAIVKISTYDFVRYGSLDGKVARIAADTNTDSASGRPYYEVIVRTDRSHLGAGPGELPITPGMQATVDIHTGARSVLSYLVKPVLKLRHEAFRER
jgi:adhesin transport system membrane fusion protein